MLFGSIYAFHRPDYAVLFSNLSPEDSAAVLSKLKDEKTPYQLADGGTTILVPTESVYEERVALAGAGVVKGGGVGFEIFDRTNLGMTDFQERVAKTRAIEGELGRTIAGLSPVEAARVNIATPEQRLYTASQAPVTASVAIKTKPGMSLRPSEVTGITMLVSRAVEGLDPQDVTIVDQDGNVLVPSATAGTADAQVQASALKMTEDQLVAKQRYETALQQNIQSMLDSTLGPKKSAVRVATDMSFDVNQTDSKTYAPQGTVRSEQTEREQYEGTGGQQAPQGVPGTTTNVVPTYQGTQAQQNGKYSKSKATRNYEITEQDVKHIDAPGHVTRTSVAVLVNVPAQAAPAAPGATANAPYTVAAADVAKIRNVVAAAAGIDPNKGDQISVEAIPFNPAVAVETGPGGGPTTVLGVPIVALAAIGLVALLGAAGAGFFYLRRRGGAAGPIEVPMPAFDTALTEELPPLEEHPMLDTAPGIAAPVRSAADITREQMVNYVTSVAQENPDSIAKLLKLWLAE